LTSGSTPDQPDLTRRIPETPVPTPSPLPEDDSEPKTGIIRRQPTGSFPALAEPTPEDAPTSYLPRIDPKAVRPSTRAVSRPSPWAASATAAVSIISGWATAVIATSLISGWWRTDQLFCVAIGFLAAVSAAASIGGLITLLLRGRIGRVLIVVGAIVAVMIFAGLLVAGAKLPPIVYAIPVLPVASVVLALLPATGRWCR
jgi:hypothetical protein